MKKKNKYLEPVEKKPRTHNKYLDDPALVETNSFLEGDEKFKPIVEKRKCLYEGCDKEFDGCRDWHIFCSKTCRYKANNQMRREAVEYMRAQKSKKNNKKKK